MQSEHRYSFVLGFRNIPPQPVYLGLETQGAEFCILQSEGGFRVEGGNAGYRLEHLSWRKDGLELMPAKRKNTLVIWMGLTVPEGIESLEFMLSELEEGVLFMDLGGMRQKSCGGPIQFVLAN